MDKRDLLIFKLHQALKRIAAYQSTERLRRDSQKDWGVDYEEALEMAYENMQEEAKSVIKGIRVPKQEAEIESSEGR